MSNAPRKYPGVFIVLEGSDGSGKTAQFKLLAERLKAVGHDVEVFDFPRYSEPSSYFVRQYLNGNYGPAGQINPYTAALFYALDRFEAAPLIRRALEAGKVVLSNRYSGSNMAHQGGKFTSQAEQRGFFVWADSLEFNLLGIPRPDINVYLRVPPKIAFSLIAKKAPRDYTPHSRDAHEADINHLKQASQAFDLLTQLFPKDFMAIDCTQDNQLLTIPTINDRIWRAIGPFLPAKKPHQAKPTTFNLNFSHSEKASQKVPKPDSVRKPGDLSSDLDDKVTSIKRISFLAAGAMEAELQRPIKIRSSLPPSKLPASFYPVKVAQPELKQLYKQTMERIGDLNQLIAKELGAFSKNKRSLDRKRSIEISSALEATTPLAQLMDIQLKANKQLSRQLEQRLASSSLAEARWLASQIDGKPDNQRPEQSRKAASALGRTTQRPQYLDQTLSRLAQTRMLKSLTSNSEAGQLAGYWPRNEFSILVDGIYPHSSLSRGEIEVELDHFTYEQKSSLMKSIIARTDNPVLAQIYYLWDVVCDRITLRRLIADYIIDDLKLQSATPRYGYEVPKIIEQAHQEDNFMECFDLSLELFSAFQSAGREDLAGYSLLMGHRLRCQFRTSAAKLQKVMSIRPGGSEAYANLLQAMVSGVKEVHPIIGDGLVPNPTELRSENQKSDDKATSKSHSRSKSK